MHERISLACIECAGPISYKSASCRGRCRECYFQCRRTRITSRRSAFRENPGTCYVDENGEVRFAEERVGRFTVGSAWSSLRKCWMGLRIARNSFDEGKALKFASRIQYLQSILGLTVTEFTDM